VILDTFTHNIMIISISATHQDIADSQHMKSRLRQHLKCSKFDKVSLKFTTYKLGTD